MADTSENSSVQNTKPSVAESQHPWPLSVLDREKAAMKANPWSYVSVFVVGLVLGTLGMWRLYETFIIPGKDATIQALQQSAGDKIAWHDDLHGVGSVTNIPTVLDPLAQERAEIKKRAEILAREIDEVADQWAKNSSKEVDEWAFRSFGNRFQGRLDKLRMDFDEHGQHSDQFDYVANAYSWQVWPQQMFKGSGVEELHFIATLIRKMANNLKD